MGGNIGRAILTLDSPSLDRVHVIEMSSFQIDLTPTLTPTVGVLLNVSPDHLDRHGTVENYAAIKARLVDDAGVAVVGIEDRYCLDVAHKLERAGKIVRRVRTEKPGTHEYGLVDNSVCYDSRFDGLVGVVDLKGIASLRGRHNAQNAVAAFAATLDMVEPAKYPAAFRSFPGLPHRMEEIGQLGPILFINDSKATNVASAEKALASWDGEIHWIAGGKPKEGGIEALTSYFGRIKGAYLIGESSDLFATVLKGKVPYQLCGTLDRALAAALGAAQASEGGSPVILFSPAAASFDQYRNFEVRGDHFRDLVSNIPGVAMRQRATV